MARKFSTKNFIRIKIVKINYIIETKKSNFE